MNNNEINILVAEENSLNISKIKNLNYLIIKRLFDLTVGVIGMLFLVPIAIIIKIIYVISGDFNSIFYSQARIGKNGKIFKMYKFRTMIPNADEELKKLLKNKKYQEEWNKNQKFDNDPRITKIGNFLRKGSLDELPQVINVFKGDLSLIGPRPLVKGELDKFNGIHEIYESVKPGITGWWAVNGRSATTYQKRLQLEYYYVKNRGIKLDTIIFFKTFCAIFGKRGAK